jgi:hypothetical protein
MSVEQAIISAEAMASQYNWCSVTINNVAPVYVPESFTVSDNVATKTYDNGSVVVLMLLLF